MSEAVGETRARAGDAVDVVVIGGGLSGLAAARAVMKAGRSVVVLEARDRVGGRTLSERVGENVFDLGGQWLGPTQRRMHALAAELGIETFPTFCTGKKIIEDAGKRGTYEGDIPALSPFHLALLHLADTRVDKLRRRVPPDDPMRAPDAPSWDGETVETWKRRLLPTAAARRVFDVAVRTVFGAEAKELSLLYFLAYLNAGGGLHALVDIANGAQETRVYGGAQQLSTGLARILGDRVVLASPVARVVQQPNEVLVETVGAAPATWKARRAILAVPPPLAARIAYEPALPIARDQLTQRFPMGMTAKAMAFYERPFWRERGLSGEVVATAGSVSCVFDNGSRDGTQPALLCFLVGDPGRAWSARPPADRKREVLEALTRFFGPDAGRPVAYVEKDWSTEPWSLGCPVATIGPGALSTYGHALRAPCGALHFAGTETAIEWTGYMEGAVEAGERAAGEAIRALSS